MFDFLNEETKSLAPAENTAISPAAVETIREIGKTVTEMMHAVRAMGEMLAHIGYGDRKAVLDKALDICTVTEKKLVITGHEDGCTGEAFTDYLIDTIRALRS
jgi:hypothetical protein